MHCPVAQQRLFLSNMRKGECVISQRVLAEMMGIVHPCSGYPGGRFHGARTHQVAWYFLGFSCLLWTFVMAPLASLPPAPTWPLGPVSSLVLVLSAWLCPAPSPGLLRITCPPAFLMSRQANHLCALLLILQSRLAPWSQALPSWVTYNPWYSPSSSISIPNV